jgi:hypothetical protein
MAKQLSKQSLQQFKAWRRGASRSEIRHALAVRQAQLVEKRAAALAAFKARKR